MSTDVNGKVIALNALRQALRNKLSFCAADVNVARQFSPNNLEKAKEVRREINRALNKVDTLFQKLPTEARQLEEFVSSQEFTATYDGCRQTHLKY